MMVHRYDFTGHPDDRIQGDLNWAAEELAAAKEIHAGWISVSHQPIAAGLQAFVEAATLELATRALARMREHYGVNAVAVGAEEAESPARLAELVEEERYNRQAALCGALSRISHALGMPGSPDLTTDVPEAVDRLMERVRRLESGRPE